MGINHVGHRDGLDGSIPSKGTVFLVRQVNDTGFVTLQKHQGAVIHRIQGLEMTNYIPHAAGHQPSLLLAVCHLIWLNPSQGNNQSMYLSISAAIET